MEEETISYTVTSSQSYYNYLKMIDKNISNATRKLIEKDINQQKNRMLEKYMGIFALGLFLIAIATLMTVLVFMGLLMAIGVFYLVYSVMRIFLWRLNREMATRTR